MDKTSLGDRMKRYELATGSILVPRTPTIIRVDGKAFHTFCRKMLTPDCDPSVLEGPSVIMHSIMMSTAMILCEEIQNAKIAYTQSDEISILLIDYTSHETQPWFGGTVQKIVSVSAALATAAFNWFWTKEYSEPFEFSDVALFDSRVFNLPKEEVTNYFVWRQQDATRNSVNFFARLYFSHKELQGKNNSEVQEMLWQEHNINWNDYQDWMKRGSCVIPNHPLHAGHDTIPVFTQDRNYINQHVFLEEV